MCRYKRQETVRTNRVEEQFEEVAARLEHALVELVEPGLLERLLGHGPVQIVRHVLHRLQHIPLRTGMRGPRHCQSRVGSGRSQVVYQSRLSGKGAS